MRARQGPYLSGEKDLVRQRYSPASHTFHTVHDTLRRISKIRIVATSLLFQTCLLFYIAFWRAPFILHSGVRQGQASDRRLVIFLISDRFDRFAVRCLLYQRYYHPRTCQSFLGSECGYCRMVPMPDTIHRRYEGTVGSRQSGSRALCCNGLVQKHGALLGAVQLALISQVPRLYAPSHAPLAMRIHVHVAKTCRYWAKACRCWAAANQAYRAVYHDYTTCLLLGFLAASLIPRWMLCKLSI